MHKKLEFKNHTSSFWRYLTIASLLSTFIFCFIWWYATDPFTISILRFIVFIGLIGSILGSLHLREKTKQISITITEDQLCINYVVDSRNEQQELFERNTIDQITKKHAPPIWTFIPRKRSCMFTISFTDTNNNLSLFRFGGQDLFVSETDAQKISLFLKNYLEGNG